MKDTFGEFIGVSDLYCAPITKDDATGYTPGANEFLAPTASIAQEPSVASKTRYYSGKPRYVSNTEGETKVTAVISGISIETAAMLLGKPYDAITKRMVDSGKSNAPWLALSFSTEVEGGTKYYSNSPIH